MAIEAVHTLIYSEDAETTRAFLRDVLGWEHVDAGGGWLIFATGPSEMGVHPTEPGRAGGTQQVSLMCDDIDATIADLEAAGVTFVRPKTDEGFGLTAVFEVPGGAGEMMIYEPRHAKAFELG